MLKMTSLCGVVLIAAISSGVALGADCRQGSNWGQVSTANNYQQFNFNCVDDNNHTNSCSYYVNTLDGPGISGIFTSMGGTTYNKSQQLFPFTVTEFVNGVPQGVSGQCASLYSQIVPLPCVSPEDWSIGGGYGRCNAIPSVTCLTGNVYVMGPASGSGVTIQNNQQSTGSCDSSLSVESCSSCYQNPTYTQGSGGNSSGGGNSSWGGGGF